MGIILSDGGRRVFWARRAGRDGWQFPQGGIRGDESPEQAMYRELFEETGLAEEHVELLGRTRGWLRYRLPRRLIRRRSHPVCIGQKQVWFLLRLVGEESAVSLGHSPKPEFDRWCWVDYWDPVDEVIFFKRRVYERALAELAPLVLPEDQRQRPGETGQRAAGRRR